MSEIGREKTDHKLLLALATGASVRDAAKKARVSERTVHRRLEAEEFRRELSVTRNRMFERAVGALADASIESVRVLRELLAADSESVRLGASRTVLEAGIKLRDAVELAERLAKLEERVELQTATDAPGTFDPGSS